jgi:hypothetical protein
MTDMVKDLGPSASQWVVDVGRQVRSARVTDDPGSGTGRRRARRLQSMGQGFVSAPFASRARPPPVRRPRSRHPGRTDGARRARRLTPVEEKLHKRLTRALGTVDEHGTTGPRLVDDAQRLWRRVQALLQLGLIPSGSDEPALELACYALQLPMRSEKNLPIGKFGGPTHLRDRSEQAAELLVAAAGSDAPEELIDRATDLLLAVPHRRPDSEEAKLLADALSLEDFGAIGLASRAIQLGRRGDGVKQLDEGNEKREQYGYWEARLRDIHFEPVRRIARERLDDARQAAKLLHDELQGDVP